MRTLTVLLFVLVLVAGAETVTFQPDATVGKDARVSSYEPDTNYDADIIHFYGISGGGLFI